MSVFSVPVVWDSLRIAPGPAEWLFSQESTKSGRIAQSAGVGRVAVAGPNTAEAGPSDDTDSGGRCTGPGGKGQVQGCFTLYGGGWPRYRSSVSIPA